jgi:hypothetical protein
MQKYSCPKWTGFTRGKPRSHWKTKETCVSQQYENNEHIRHCVAGIVSSLRYVRFFPNLISSYIKTCVIEQSTLKITAQQFLQIWDYRVVTRHEYTRSCNQRLRFSWAIKKLRGFESASELYRLSDRRRSAKLMSTFPDRGCHVVSAMSPSDRNFDFLDLEPLLFLPSSSSNCSRGW